MNLITFLLCYKIGIILKTFSDGQKTKKYEINLQRSNRLKYLI